MTKKIEEFAEPADYESTGYHDDPIHAKGNPRNDYEDGECSIERKYEKYRDDQTNTGVIAALLGGFALTNSWEMEVAQGGGSEISKIDIAAYSLAITSVHLCTCSALVSAFLYRSLTQQTTCQKGVEWMERQTVIRKCPWYKFLIGTLCYVMSVGLVAWKTLDISILARIITLAAAATSSSFLMYACWMTENADPKAESQKQ